MTADTPAPAPPVLPQITVAKIQRRTLTVLSFVQAMGGIAVAGAVAAGALIAAGLGGDASAGLAQTAGVLGAALLSLPLARLALSRGRRVALSTGLFIGAAGAATVVLGGGLRSLWLVLIGSVLLGVAQAAGYQGRYAATDLATEEHRGKALAIVVWASTIGAVLGPNLLEFSGSIALGLGLPQLTGPYLLATLVLVLAGVVLMLFLRPDPYLLARRAAAAQSESPATVEHPKIREAFGHLRAHPRAVLGIASVSIGHVAMVMVMVMTPVHMAHVDVSLRLIGLVISVHVLGMFAFSPAVGWAVDRFGRDPIIVAGAVILIVSCAVSAVAPPQDVVVLGIGLFLLGLGWSFTLIAGSTLLTDESTPSERPAIQGLSDLTMNVAGAIGGALAGVIMLGFSYAALCAVAALPVLGLLWLTWRRRLAPSTTSLTDQGWQRQ
jgi:MFS family permease